MADALQLAFRVKPGEFYHNECTTQEERKTFVCCKVSPELLFSSMAKPIAAMFPELLPLL